MLWLAAALAGPDLLFIGNSYTFRNDLDLTTAAVLEELGQTPTTGRLAEPGWSWSQHVAAAQDVTSAHHAAILTSTQHVDAFILQEQSQIPGFPQSDPAWTGSLAAARQLDAWAQDRGAATWLLQTWGRRDGDADNAALYPDYATMQGRLIDGYDAYAAALSTEARPVHLVRAGEAWTAVRDGVIQAGDDPTRAGSLFARLYDGDGSHPSPIGTRLIAWVVAASWTGRSVVGLSAPASLTPEEADALQRVADAVAGVEPGDTVEPTDTPTTDAPEDVVSDRQPCGCAHLHGLAWAGLAAGVIGRRRLARPLVS